MAGTKAEKPLITTTISVFADEWEEFKVMVGERQASARLRKLMREDLNANHSLTTASR